MTYATSKNSIDRLPLLVVFFIWAMYLASLCLPALIFSQQPDGGQTGNYVGLALLMLGWIEALGGSTSGIAWLANPTFALGTLTLLIKRFGLATIFFVIACGLASATFDLKEVCIDEGGTIAAIVRYGPGFWLWFSTMFVSCVISFSLWLTKKLRSEPEIA